MATVAGIIEGAMVGKSNFGRPASGARETLHWTPANHKHWKCPKRGGGSRKRAREEVAGGIGDVAFALSTRTGGRK
ncbi:MAG: hypothetical protein ACE5NJ_10815, partial [Thermodesulfobacteriota bacterium]